MTKLTKAQQIAAQLNSKFGPGTIKMGSDEQFVVKRLPTGVLPIDDLLDGGLPRGRSVEFYGDYSSLKSYIGLKAVATTQKAGDTACALIDTEHSFDADWATSLGVDVDSLILKQPRTGELAMDITETLIGDGIDLVVWDSVAATLPDAEATLMLSGDKGQQRARLAALMSTGLRKLTTVNYDTALMFINQTRINPNITFGSPQTQPGGKALPFYASIRVALSKMGKVTEARTAYVNGKEVKGAQAVLGEQIKASLVKSKLSRPHRDRVFLYDLQLAAIDDLDYLISCGLQSGAVIRKGTSSWEFGTIRARGSDPFKTAIRNDPMAMSDLIDVAIETRLDPALYGASPPPRRRAVKRSAKSSGSTTPGRTPAVAPAAKRSTAATTKKSSRSSTTRRPTH